ncbi:MAG: response regulator, partial [Anaerolineales bacterium]|nr:response regulator [Anaerolineales bacterium]
MQDTIDVLIIEDNGDDAELMVLELEMAGFTVVWHRVETKDDFLTHLNTQVDIVLADYNLPQFTAPRALDLLLSYGFDTPFIVVTGSISEEIAVACIKQGAADYLLKDRLSRLGEAVRQAIKQRDLRRAQREAEQNLLIMNRAIDTSINAVVLADLSGRITYVNKAF